jgi:hypothetical protein
VTPEELFLEWGAAWTARDPAEKERRLRGCCTDDVEFIPPDERPVMRGIDTLVEHTVTYTSKWPEGTTCRLSRPPETHHGWSRGLVHWVFPDATAQGTDIIRIVDGRIATMLVFADGAPQS